MAASVQSSSDALCAGILADARRECETILAHAREEAKRILADADADAARIRREQQDQTAREAAHRTQTILATVAVESRRRRGTRTEELLESMHEEIRRRLASRDPDGRAGVVALAGESIRRMIGMDFEVSVSPADFAAFGNILNGEIEQRAGRSPLRLRISGDPSVTAGVVVRDGAGRQLWDNELRSRLERWWPDLRRQMAMTASLMAENHSAGEGS